MPDAALSTRLNPMPKQSASAIVLLRWFIANPGRPAYRAAEEIVRAVVTPIVARLHKHKALESLYVSKQNGREVWLTVFVPHTSVIKAISDVEPRLTCFPFRSCHIDDPKKDEILRAACDDFRRCIHRMTRIALELHAAAQLPDVQRELVRLGCKKRDDRTSLHPFLMTHSASYAALPDHDHFWQTFTSNCLSGATDCGHWLYNIVLGVDGFQGEPEQLVFNLLGL